jgi:hypothetical protein
MQDYEILLTTMSKAGLEGAQEMVRPIRRICMSSPLEMHDGALNLCGLHGYVLGRIEDVKQEGN